MINYENCLNFIENELLIHSFQTQIFETNRPIKAIKLTKAQKILLKNLIEGNITDCPRGIGKTFVIKLYAEYLNHIHDTCKYDKDIICDDYISGTECSDDSLFYKRVKDSLYINKEMGMKEFNISEDEIGMYIISEENNFNLGIK